MEEEMLLENVSGTLFPDRDETQNPDNTETSLFASALDDGEAEFGLSASNLDRLEALRDTIKNSDEGLAKLIDEAIGENIGNGQVSDLSNASEKSAEDNSTIAEFNSLPEESAGDKNDDDNSGSDPRRTVVGTDDDDLIVATGEQDEIFGKKGDDTIKGNRDKKNKIYGGKGDDDCEGGDDDDEIKGDRDKDKLNGGKGNDTINGGKDNDSIFGGSDKDICKGDDGDDWVHGNEGDDDVDGGAGSDTVYGGKGDDKCEGGEGNDTVRGDRGNDNVSGGDGDDNLNGGKDNDTVIGGAGSDVCSGDDGDDTVSGGIGDDTVSGGADSDVCSGDDGDDSVSGGTGDDTVSGGAGSDVCSGDDGDDSVSGGDGKDTLIGGSGNDVCSGDDGDDSVIGGDGDDTVMGGAGSDTLVTGDGNDMADGGDGDDSVVGGGNGDDTLMGGTGNDTLMGGTGNHTCVGGAGDDVFVMSNTTTTNTSVITDYTDDSDKFLLFGDLNFSSLTFVQVGVNTEIRVNNFALTLLLNVNATILNAGDFLGVNVSGNNNVSTPTPTPGLRVVTPPSFNQTIFNFAGNTVAQVIVGSTTLANNITGGDAGNDITGGNAQDTIKGGKGKDTIKGGDGDDDIDGGDGDDDIKVGKGNNKIKGGLGKDTIKGGDGDNDIDGGDDDDDIEVGKGKNKIIGGKGKDKIKVGDGDNDIDGGDDDDDIEVGKGKNKIIGGLGNDKIKGGDGDDSIEGGLGTNTLIGGAGKDRFIYRTSREEIKTVAQADLITDFNVDDDILEFSTSAFANLSVSSLTRLVISATSVFGSIGSANLLDFSDDISVTSIATLQARFAALGGNPDAPTFCQFTDAETGRSVLVFAVGARFDIVASFSLKIRLQVTNFVFTGPSLTVPVGTAGPDNVNFSNFSIPVNFDGLAGDDNIVGSNLNDTLQGGDGNDTITGNLGADVLSGGTGADLFVYRTTKEGGDKITDFKAGTDKFQFVASEFGNLTTTNFDGVSGSTPDITGKELVIFTGGSYASLEAAQAKALGNSTTAGFFAFTNASNETVLYFDSNGTTAGGSTLIANLGTAASNLGTADFVFTNAIATSPTGTSTNSGSVVDLTAAGNTFPIAFNNFGSGVGGYNFTTPVLFTGNDSANSVTGTEFADIINGGGGADILSGGSGADILSGGSGADVLTGGAGADIFVYKAAGEGPDTITDFTFGVDKFQFVSSAFGNLTTTNFDGVSGVSPDITGKELVIFTQGSYASLEAAQAKALGNSTSAGFFAFTNASNETVLYFDSNGTTAGGSTLIANLGTAASNLGTADFVFTGSVATSPTGTSTNSGSVADLTAAGNTFPIAFNNFGSGAGGYNFTSPVLFTGDAAANSVTGTEFADILSGGSGADVLTGGAGADIFVYKAAGEGPDTITDFAFGVDKLQFSANAFGNLTTTNFDGVSGVSPDITGKELVIFTGGSYASLEAAQAKALGNSTSAGFFAFTNAANETVLYFDSNGTTAGGSTLIANLGTAAGTLGTADFVFTGSIASSGTSPTGTSTNTGSVADLTAAGNTFPIAFNNFGSGAGGYNFTTPVLFTGNDSANSVTGTEFADIFSGGTGADVLTGGAGADIFVYKAAGEGGDTITDFTSGTDKFQFTANAFGNLTTTNFDGVTGSTPDITGKELVIFTGGSYASLEAAQAKALGNSTSAGFFAFTNASNETVLYFDSNGTTAGGSTLIANLGTAASNLGTADFVFTGTIAASAAGTSTNTGSVADLTAAGNTFPIAFNNFGSGAGGYNFTSPVLFTGDAAANSVTGTEFADILSGGSGADIFDGGLGNDSISGDDGNDSLFGGGGSDTLNGGIGNDTLIGGVGTNVLNGGAGLDVFVFSGTAAGGGDLITNYSIADDVINLDKTGFAAFTTGSGPLGSSFYAYSSTVGVTALEATLTGPSIMAIYDSLSASTKLYYDSNGSTVGGNSLFATVDVNLGVSGNSELFLF